MEWIVKWTGVTEDAGPFPDEETAKGYAETLYEDFPLTCQEFPPEVLPSPPESA